MIFTVPLTQQRILCSRVALTREGRRLRRLMATASWPAGAGNAFNTQYGSAHEMPGGAADPPPVPPPGAAGAPALAPLEELALDGLRPLKPGPGAPEGGGGGGLGTELPDVGRLCPGA